MSGPLITRAQLEARLSAEVVRYVLDDSNTGDADDDALNQVITDATSKVRGKLGPAMAQAELDPTVHTELVRIALDIAHGYLALRFPEIMRIDGFELMKIAQADLAAIRIGQADLGGTAPPDLRMGARVISAGGCNRNGSGW